MKLEAELAKKDAELMMKDQDLEGQRKQLEALEVKMKASRSNLCGMICVFVFGMVCAMIINAIRMS